MTRYLLPVATSVALLVACGLVHGFWTDRWEPAPDPAAVAARFDALATDLGDWQGEALPVGPRETRGLSGYLVRRYVNRRTGDAVTVALMSGPPRVVSIHTPDACYAASGFAVSPPARHAGAALPEPADFWTSEMVRTRAAEQTRLRIFYAWSNGGPWAAPDNARLSFAGTRALYKLYLIREVASGNTPPGDDPCLALMAALQPELTKCL